MVDWNHATSIFMLGFSVVFVALWFLMLGIQFVGFVVKRFFSQ